jgi:hypothetical protein
MPEQNTSNDSLVPDSGALHVQQAAAKAPSTFDRETISPLQRGADISPTSELADLDKRLQVHAPAYGRKRGSLLVQLLTHNPSPEKRAAIIEEVAALDKRFEGYAAHFAGTVIDKEGIRERYAEHARIAQDTEIYLRLKDRFLIMGREIGEAKGRVIDENRLGKHYERLGIIECRIEKCLQPPQRSDATLPDEIALDTEPVSGIQSALRAAVLQGERAGVAVRIEAEADAAALYRAFAGWKEYLPPWFPQFPFKQFSVVHDILAGKGKNRLGYIKEAFLERHHMTLEQALRTSFGEAHIPKIRWLMEGDTTGALAMDAARQLTSMFCTKNGRSDGLRDIYLRISSGDIPRFERQLAEQLKIDRESLENFISSRVTPQTAQKLQCIRGGDRPREQALHVSDLLHRGGSKALQIRHLFRGMDAGARFKLEAKYQDEFGQSLRDALSQKLPQSPARDLCLAVLDGDRQRYLAAEIRCAFIYRDDWIGKPFYRVSEAERKEKIAAYQTVYGSDESDFYNDLRAACHREDYPFVHVIPSVSRFLEHFTWPFTNSYPFLKTLVDTGDIPAHQRVRYYLLGLGTDVDGIYAEIEDLTVNQKNALSAAYRDEYWRPWSPLVARIPIINQFVLIGDLRHDLKVELSGDHEFDIGVHLEGLPTYGNDRELCETLMNRVRRRFDHEFSGKLVRMRDGALNHLRGDGAIVRMFRRDHLNVVHFYREHIEGRERLEPEHIQRFCTLVKLFEIQADAYREAKIALSGIVLNSGAALGATVGASLSVFIAHWHWSMTMLAAGSGSLLWRWAQGTAILGRGFGKTDATFQAMRAFVDGASMFMVRLGAITLSSFLGRQLSGSAVKGTFKTSLNKLFQNIEQRITRQNKAQHLIEARSPVLASDEQLSGIIDDFQRLIVDDPSAVSSHNLMGGESIEMVWYRALGISPQDREDARLDA